MHGYGNRFAFVGSDAGAHCEGGFVDPKKRFYLDVYLFILCVSRTNKIHGLPLVYLYCDTSQLHISVGVHSDIYVTRIQGDQMCQH